MIVIYCNTYYQLITAVQLCLTDYKNTKRCILIDSKLKSADFLVQKLLDTKIVYAAFVVYDRYDKWRIWMFSTLLKKQYEHRIRELFSDEEGYSCLMECQTYLFANIGGAALCLGEYIYQKNPKVKISMYEDGVSSYSRIFGDMILAMLHPQNIFKKLIYSIFKTPYHHISNYYLYLPELIVWNCPFSVKRIPPINVTLNELKDVLNILFDCVNVNEEYKEKVIFFEESYYADGLDVGDMSIIEDIDDKFGKDQIIIKLHPRSKINRFEASYHTNSNTSIPWEVVALNISLKDKILATISSTALLSSFLLSDGNTKLLFCYSQIDCSKDLRLRYTVEVIKKLENLYPDAFISL